jgi:hypothetical protein
MVHLNARHVKRLLFTWKGTLHAIWHNQKILAFLKDLADVLGKVPTQSFGEGISDFHDMDDEQRLAVLRVLQRKPPTNRVKEIFGSWLKALIEADVLEDGARKTARGIQTIARDGHVCLSLGEKTIDDYLFGNVLSLLIS